jgi:WXG100 family type VII secretion target
VIDKGDYTMATQITMTPAEMRNTATTYGQKASDLENIISSMTQSLNNLKATWQGDASASYDARWNSDLKPSLQKARDLINEIKAALEKTANIVEETDAKIAQQFNA